VGDHDFLHPGADNAEGPLGSAAFPSSFRGRRIPRIAEILVQPLVLRELASPSLAV